MGRRFCSVRSGRENSSGIRTVAVALSAAMTSHAISFLSEDKKLKKNSLADKRSKRVTLATKFFTLEEVQLLAQTLEVKFNLICHINKLRNGYVIRISAKSLPVCYTPS